MVSELHNGTAGVYSGPPSNSISLPEELPGFLGREAEILQIRNLLRERNLVTLLGVGGVGKTRLAIHLAGESRKQFGDGVFFVPFDSIVSSEFIVDAVAMFVGIKLNPRLDPF